MPNIKTKLNKVLPIVLELIILINSALIVFIVVSGGFLIGPINLMRPYIPLFILVLATMLRFLFDARLSILKNPISYLLLMFFCVSSLSLLNSWVAYVTFGFSNFHDFAFYNQSIFNFVHGRGFANSVWQNANLFGNHSEFILIPFGIIYAFWQSPLCLLFIQTIIITGGIFPLYFLAKRKIKSGFWSLVICLSYLTFPPILNFIGWTEFFAIVFVIPILFTAFYFYDKDKRNIFIALMLLAILVKEEVCLAVSTVGLYVIFFSRNKKKINYKVGLVLLFIGIISFFFMIKIAIPLFNEGKPYLHFTRLIGSDNVFTLLLKNPLIIFESNDYFHIGKIKYFFDLFFRTGFIPLFSLFFIVPLSNWAQVILSPPVSVTSQNWHNTLIIAFIFISLVFGLYNIKRINKIFYNIALFVLLLMVITKGLPSLKESLISPLQSRGVFIKTLSWERYNNLKEALHFIPQNSPIYTTFKILPYASSREKLYWYPRIKRWFNADYILFAPNTFLNITEVDKLKEGLESKIFVKIKQVGDFQIWKKY